MNELRKRLQAKIDKADCYKRLYDNSDFQLWKSEVIQKRQDMHRKMLVTADPFTEEGQKIIKKAYSAMEELDYIGEIHFSVWEKLKEEAYRLINRKKKEQKG